MASGIRHGTGGGPGSQLFSTTGFLNLLNNKSGAVCHAVFSCVCVVFTCVHVCVGVSIHKVHSQVKGFHQHVFILETVIDPLALPYICPVHSAQAPRYIPYLPLTPTRYHGVLILRFNALFLLCDLLVLLGHGCQTIHQSMGTSCL